MLFTPVKVCFMQPKMAPFWKENHASTYLVQSFEFWKHASLGEISGTQLIYYIKEKIKEFFITLYSEKVSGNIFLFYQLMDKALTGTK